MGNKSLPKKREDHYWQDPYVPDMGVQIKRGKVKCSRKADLCRPSASPPTPGPAAVSSLSLCRPVCAASYPCGFHRCGRQLQDTERQATIQGGQPQLAETVRRGMPISQRTGTRHAIPRWTLSQLRSGTPASAKRTSSFTDHPYKCHVYSAPGVHCIRMLGVTLNHCFRHGQ